MMTPNEKEFDPQISREIEQLTRTRVIRQLHDGLTQTVSALAMRINFARRLINSDPEAASMELEKVESLTREATKEIRRVIFLLQPVEQAGFNLLSQLESLVAKLSSLYDIRFDVQVDSSLSNQLPDQVQYVLYCLVDAALDTVGMDGAVRNATILLVSTEGNLAQLSIHVQNHGDDGDPPQYNENMEKFASLIGGSVMFEDGGRLVQTIFPITHRDAGGELR